MRARSGVTSSAACALTMLLLSGAALGAPLEDIRGIRGPKALPAFWNRPEFLLTATLAVLCLACLLWHWMRRRERPLSLAEATLRRLEDTRALMSPDTAQAFGFCASEVIRHYIEQRFNVVATRQTTEEFLRALLQGSNAVLARYRTSLAQFLQQCDCVKFTGDPLTANDMELLLRTARGFVLETDELPAG